MSEAPSASWHPALMPNSISGRPRSPPKDVSPGSPAQDPVAQDAPDLLASDEVEEDHDRSVGADAWFPDYGTGAGWTKDANPPTIPETEHEHEPEHDVPDAAADEGADPGSTASKHLSTMSFTRTVPHEVNWNDDDDPEWNLARTGTDPFKFMPPSDRTNSFPAIPSPEHTVEEGHAAPEAAQEPTTGLNADPEAFVASFVEEELEADDDFFQQTVGGNLSGTTEEAMEARFEEGVPLIPSGVHEPVESSNGQGGNNLFGEEDAAEEDDFFSKAQDTQEAHPEDVPTLERKSTMQVIGSLNDGPKKPAFAPLAEASEEDADAAPEHGQAEETPALAQPESTEDLDAKWKAVFGEDEEDGFLPDEGIDAAGFLGSDDEGFLDDSEAPLPTAQSPAASFPQASPALESKVASGRYLPPGQASTTPVPSNPYFPSTPAHVPAPAPLVGNPYLPAVSPALSQPPVPSPYPAAPITTAPPRYGPTAPPSTQEQNKPQSFVDKAKGGYTSPYNLPMEVVKPKLRAPIHTQRSISTPAAPPPGPPAPPRSASLTSPGLPTRPGFGAGPSPPTSSHGQPPSAGHPVPAPGAAKAPAKFFEELPITTKPRPSSRHSNKSVPSPPPTNPYAAPPHHGPPHVAQAAFTPPPSSHPVPDIPKLVPPPRVSPYAALPSNTAPSPTAPPVAASRYSPASASMPSLSGPPPAAAASRYSPAPPARHASAGYAPAVPASAPPMLAHQPRTSSPLAHFEISHERSRAPNHHPEGSLADKRTASSVYESRLQRVPSLPPTTEVEEDDSQIPAQTPTQYIPTPPSTSPESRHGQVPHRARQTPPPPAFHNQSSLSPSKRATSSHGLASMSQDFAPPPRSQTQSPGKLHGNRNGKVIEPGPRPSSVHGPAPPQPAAAAAYAPTAPSHFSAPSRPRGASQNFNLVAPTDGREKDPLQRWRGVPLISWGVGGTMVTMFPKDVPRYGINQSVPMVVRSPGEVKVQSAKDVQPLEERLMKFPGPLKGKSKKKETVAWLTTGIESLERDRPSHLHAQLHQSHDDKRMAERVLLWKILRLLVEHDGILEGNPTVEKAVRDVLSPNLESADGAPAFMTAADASRLNESAATRMRSDAVDSSVAEHIQKHLQGGESEKAIWAAADARLWGHALLIANALAPELYKKVAQEFIKKEVNYPGHNNESLAVLYGVLSGNHEESVDELVPVHARAGLQLVAKNAGPVVPKDGTEGLDKWRETLSLILSNRSPGDAQSIIALGNLLSDYGRAEAAHICYMFARNQAVFGGLDDPSSNFVLVGSDHKRQAEQFAKEIEPLLLSEVYEYGQSLAGGSNVAVTNPHLAAYKLQHAYALAEYGYRDKALQYCEAIFTAITAQTKRSPYHHPLLEAAVDDLTKRLRQAPKEESNSWIPKPSVSKVSDSVWNRFNKFVAGDDNDDSGQGSPKDGEASGPFARVAGGTPTISRPPSTNNLETFGAAVPSYGMPVALPNGPVAASAPPTRAASRYAPASSQPMAHTTNPYEPSSTYAPRSSMERVSGEYTRTSSDLQRQSSELQRGNQNAYNPNPAFSPPNQGYMPYNPAPAPAPVPEQHHASQPPASQYQPPTSSSGYEPPNHYPAPVNGTDSGRRASGATNGDRGYQPSSNGYEPPSFTPFTAPVGEEKETAQNGMENGSEENPSFQPYGYEPPSYQPYGFEPSSQEPESQPSNEDGGSSDESKPKPKKKGIMYDDDDDDIPMPAMKSKEKTKAEKDRENEEMFRKAAEEDAKRAAEAKQAKKGWGFTSWFGGGGAAGAKKETQEASNPNKPIRAKLGEANSFYYDPELKRWVNKNADPKDNEAKKATPPPPKAAPRSVSSSPAPPMGMPGPTSHPESGRASAPPTGPPRSTMAPPPSLLTPSASDVNLAGPPTLGPPAMMRSASNTSTASAPSRPTTSLSNSSSIDDLLSAAGPRKGGAKKPRKSARYVDVMTKE
ncbi:putative COPII coat assembly protein sec-16 [Echria macrotheca]|uniref:Protein transport protein sec16 n=1 Tax=Echria macrotheca TaxID=438768 RepID=A0AAJ0BQ61_9PEZI|nr:putative COPII coat assembly protein sec-16 [Echria macrotheca]